MDSAFSLSSSVFYSQFRKPLKADTSSMIRHRKLLGFYLHSPERFRYSLRCSIADSNLNVANVVDDEVPIDDHLPPIEGLSEPILHLNTEILTSGSLGLITETKDVDYILTGLRVLSEDEQKLISSTPAHPLGLYAFYCCCFCGNLVEQLWSFAWPSAIALLHPSLLPVAVIGFYAKLSIVIGGPLVGKIMDSAPRLPSYTCLNVTQAAAQILSALILINAYNSSLSSTSSILLRPWFVVLVIASSAERLCGVAAGVATERDWVVLLAGVNRPIALAKANAVLAQINLLCEALGAAAFGFLLSRYGPVSCLKFSVVLIASSLPIVVGLSWLTNALSSGVVDRSKHTQNLTDGEKLDFMSIVTTSWETLKLGLKEYVEQPALPASLAYVLLFFNVVLAPGSLMTTFLTQRGVNPSIIGVFSGTCSCMGVAATLLSPLLVTRMGILKAGAIGLILQAVLLSLAVWVYVGGPITNHGSMIVFLGCIAVSRLGNMIYDVIGQQILQSGAPEGKANLIGVTELSVASLAESLMLGIAIFANDPSHFGILAIFSLASVTGAAWLFCYFLLRPNLRSAIWV